MTHIRKVGIRNYRSIAKANLRLGEITVVIGPSDCGKSNIVRSLRDWAHNASGSDFVTLGWDKTRVACAVGDDLRVLFEKSVLKRGSKSRYAVDRHGEESVSYEKIGTNVPPEVSVVTGIQELELDKDLRLKINFSMQDDPWFLLSAAWTPSRVAKVVGKISGVDTLILAQRDLVQDRNWTKKEVKDSSAGISTAEEALTGLEWVSEAREVLDSVRDSYDDLVGLKRSLRDAEAAVATLRRLRNRQAGLQARHAALAEFALDLGERGYEEDVTRLESAEALLSRVSELNEQAGLATQRHEGARRDLARASADLRALAKEGGVACPLCNGEAHAGCLEGLAREAEEASQ